MARIKSWRARAKEQARETNKKRKISKPWIEYLGAETREQISIIEELSLQAWMKDIDWWHTPSEGKRDEFNAWFLKKMGGKKNIPDFIIAESRGGFNGLWMEYKKTGTKLFKTDGSPYAAVKDQWEFLQRMEKKINVKIALVAGPEEAINTIKAYLMLS